MQLSGKGTNLCPRISAQASITALPLAASATTPCRARRYTLGEVKVELMEAMGLNTEAEGSRMQFLRRGYKTTTWWEDDDEQERSDAWRT